MKNKAPKLETILTIDNRQIQLDWFNKKLTRAEQNGFTDSSKNQILEESKSRSNG